MRMTVLRVPAPCPREPAAQLGRSAWRLLMKILLIVIGSLAGLYTAAALVQFIYALVSTNAGTAYGTANIAASVVPVCIGLLVCVACFAGAFKKPKP